MDQFLSASCWCAILTKATLAGAVSALCGRLLEIGTGPAHPDDRATLGRALIFEGQDGARPFEQGLGDEKAQTQSAPGRTADVEPPVARASDVGLAKPI